MTTESVPLTGQAIQWLINPVVVVIIIIVWGTTGQHKPQYHPLSLFGSWISAEEKFSSYYYLSDVRPMFACVQTKHGK